MEDLATIHTYQQASICAAGNAGKEILAIFIGKLVSLLTVNHNTIWPPKNYKWLEVIYPRRKEQMLMKRK